MLLINSDNSIQMDRKILTLSFILMMFISKFLTYAQITAIEK